MLYVYVLTFPEYKMRIFPHVITCKNGDFSYKASRHSTRLLNRVNDFIRSAST